MLVMDGVLICFWSQLSISGDRGILHEKNSWSFMFRKFRFFVSILFCAGSGIIQERECRVTLEPDDDIDARFSCLPEDNEKEEGLKDNGSGFDGSSSVKGSDDDEDDRDSNPIASCETDKLNANSGFNSAAPCKSGMFSFLGIISETSLQVWLRFTELSRGLRYYAYLPYFHFFVTILLTYILLI
ncbi:uncharacterized protein LOC132644786 isoform X2 [Lycium barbarum]|uniref:uncharacterized protein LOC132644786 isoform X2 n=1 Tax=Lycium barbarum TaxID=112863 RepID=UPI00293E4C20|nr:uncharacterized protein LOC132644786 isoform X2 [Lycium barbarum]XP_060217372.1 uncharacterized protein LOC132644786 isoform X2 [Lycium barbarum]